MTTLKVFVSLALFLFLAGCSGSSVKPWVTDPYDGLDPLEVFVGIGVSQLASVDIAGARTDAETDALNKIQASLFEELERLTQRNVKVLKDIGLDDSVFGSHTIKDINNNYVTMKIKGARIVEYDYYPDEINPERIYVKRVLYIDHVELADHVLSSFETELRNVEAKERLGVEHDEAMDELRKERDRYLEIGGN